MPAKRASIGLMKSRRSVTFSERTPLNSGEGGVEVVPGEIVGGEDAADEVEVEVACAGGGGEGFDFMFDVGDLVGAAVLALAVMEELSPVFATVFGGDAVLGVDEVEVVELGGALGLLAHVLHRWTNGKALSQSHRNPLLVTRCFARCSSEEKIQKLIERRWAWPFLRTTVAAVPAMARGYPTSGARTTGKCVVERRAERSGGC